MLRLWAAGWERKSSPQMFKAMNWSFCRLHPSAGCETLARVTASPEEQDAQKENGPELFLCSHSKEYVLTCHMQS